MSIRISVPEVPCVVQAERLQANDANQTEGDLNIYVWFEVSTDLNQ